jgi:tetratricopeptide (TPR) repeat protein
MEISGNSVSDVTMGASLVDQVHFYQEALELDPTTALLLHKAETHREKNQLKIAQKYYEKVLNLEPNCAFATNSAEVVASLIADEAIEQQTKRHQEASVARKRSLAYNKTEMSVSWNSYYYFDCAESKPDIDAIATKKIKKELLQMGFGQSILSLTDNKVIDKDTDGEGSLWTGRANFQVLFVPDEETDTPSDAVLSSSGQFQQDRGTVVGVAMDNSHLSGSTNEQGGSAGSSRFADRTEDGW